MKNKIKSWCLLPFISTTLLALSSCSTEPAGEKSRQTTFQHGEPGGVMVDTYKESATVTGIDKAKRKVTLTTKDGDKETFKAGPEVANFDQLEIGDQVKATVTDRLVVFVRKPGERANNGSATAVALSPLGAKPGVMMADTVEITARVKSIDVERHKATLQFPDGKTKTFEVRKDVDLTKQQVGAEVVFRATEAMAIVVEKP